MLKLRIDHKISEAIPLWDKHSETFRSLMRDFGHLNERGNMLLGMDVMRFFGVGLLARDGQIDYCRDAIVLQYLVDELNRTPFQPYV